MSGPSFGALVVVDEPVAGIADRLAAWDDADEDAAVERLLNSLAADGISLSTDRGPRDAARRIYARIRGQLQVEDLGEIDASFEMVGLHVPSGGRAALEMRRSAASERRISATAMGLGFGSGRKMELELQDDIPERGACMRVSKHVVLRVRSFSVPGKPTEPLVRTDVVAWGHQEMSALPDCPHCGASVEDLNPVEFDEDIDQAADTRPFDTAMTRRTKFTLEGSRKADIGVKLALLGVGPLEAGFQLEQRTTISCTASYTFPAGRFFVPYRRRIEPATLPYWTTR
jgi:hypothetical protein